MSATGTELNPPIQLHIPKHSVLRFFILGAILLHLLNVAAVWIKYGDPSGDSFLGEFFVRFFQVSSEGILPTAYSVIALFFCAVLLAFIALAAYRRLMPFRFHWALLAVIFVLLSLDEGLEIHDLLSSPVRSALQTSGPFYYAWVIPAGLFVLCTGLYYLRFLLALPPRSKRLFCISASVYLFGVLGMEMIGSDHAHEHGDTLGYGVIASVEEVAEMTGVILFIHALIDYIERQVGRLSVSFT